MEPFGLIAGRLTKSRVDDEPAVIGFEVRVDLCDLIDQIIFQGMTSGGIDDDNIHVFQGGKSVFDDFDSILLFRISVTWDIDLFAERFELGICSGPEVVGADRPDFQTFSLEVAAEFSGRGGLTRTLQTGHQDLLRF